MRLSSLFPDKDLICDPDILTLCEDSRTASAGALFFAHAGSREHGLKYISDSIMRGCVAIVVPEGVHALDLPIDLPIIHVENTRREIARCAALIFPHQPEKIVAVTGTSGKTSTTFFVQQLLNLTGHKAVSIGTIGVSGAGKGDSALTTPQAPALHALLSDLSTQGITHVALEASSQALHQHRMDYVHLCAAAFTNLSHDHLDYHETRENYLAAKTRLFSDLLPASGIAVLNADDTACSEFSAIVTARGHRVMTYGHATQADLRLIEHVLTPTGQELFLKIHGQNYRAVFNVAGAFQAGNLMAALALCHALGVSFDTLIPLVPRLIAPPGRLQYIPGHPHGASIYVDYAHKPDALENVLTNLHAHAPCNLICVFGCGGDRDATKRPIMGEIAARLCTRVIITDDNPRSEDAAKIRAAIRAACPGSEENGDRRAAIRQAIFEAQTDDIVLIAGKGHEQGQIFADHTDPFDDVEACESAIRELSFKTPSSKGLLT